MLTRVYPDEHRDRRGVRDARDSTSRGPLRQEAAGSRGVRRFPRPSVGRPASAGCASAAHGAGAGSGLRASLDALSAGSSLPGCSLCWANE